MGLSDKNLVELAEQLTLGCRILAEQEIIDAYGQISARIPDTDTHFMINRGMSPALVTASDFLVCDLDGGIIDGDGHPNAEWPIHTSIYRARPDVRSILHSHSRLSRIFSLSHRKLRGLISSSAPDWQGGLPLYRAAGLITTVERGAALAKVLGNSSAALLRGHGDVTATGSIKNTVLKAITLKQNADVLHEVISHGGEIELWNESDLADWANVQRASLSPAAIEALGNRAWDYYVARVNGRLAGLLHPEKPWQA
ncbi:MAG: class II aldolase/adducin family protein [Proteobacteria bacterium]|nr:class II aldolase/adducin family protein [Pseudomonadota bacterium]